MRVKIVPPAEYNMLLSIHAWIYPDIQPVPERTSSDGLFSRMMTIELQHVPVLARQEGTGGEIMVMARPYPDDNATSTRALKTKMRRTLCLDLDLTGVHNLMADDPLLSAVSKEILSVRPYLTDTPFEALAKSIIQQQISYRAANSVTRRLILRANLRADVQGETVYHFPPPSEILAIGAEGLREIGLGRKSEYLADVARLVERGELDLDGLFGATYDEIREVLLPVRGVGVWTVQATAIAGLGEFSTFPYGDLGIRNLLARLLERQSPLPTAEVERTAERWGEFGPLVLYLLMCADVLGLVRESRVWMSKTHKR